MYEQPTTTTITQQEHKQKQQQQQTTKINLPNNNKDGRETCFEDQTLFYEKLSTLIYIIVC